MWRVDLRIVLTALHVLFPGIPGRVKQEEHLEGMDGGESRALLLVCSVGNRSGRPGSCGLESALGVGYRSLRGSRDRRKAGCVREVGPGY